MPDRHRWRERSGRVMLGVRLGQPFQYGLEDDFVDLVLGQFGVDDPVVFREFTGFV
jgi:hypothetical protein